MNLGAGHRQGQDRLYRLHVTGLDGEQKLEQGKDMYYRMMGWDEVRGAPRLEKLQELGIDWVAETLK